MTTFPLAHPITAVNALAVRRPKGRDYVTAEMETGSLRRHYGLYASIAGIDLETFLELDVDDIAAFIDVVDSAAGESPRPEAGAT